MPQPPANPVTVDPCLRETSMNTPCAATWSWWEAYWLPIDHQSHALMNWTSSLIFHLKKSTEVLADCLQLPKNRLLKFRLPFTPISKLWWQVFCPCFALKSVKIQESWPYLLIHPDGPIKLQLGCAPFFRSSATTKQRKCVHKIPFWSFTFILTATR